MTAIRNIAAYAILGLLVALYLFDAYVTASMRIG